ncbi:hypothetical protein [Bosea sp. 2RAB26]|uniref:hypothetical protein n=1 Tax=Bosea sp. 2RAB26 TaxID=3237476 RepID=UPI003F8F96B2
MSVTLAARAHSNATLSAPARRAPPARRKASFLMRIWRATLRRPGRSLILTLFSAAAAAILMNALLFQKARHPSPILSQSTTATPSPRNAERRTEQAPAAAAAAPAPAASVPAEPAQLPPSRPGGLTQAAREAAPRPPASVNAAPRPAPTQAAAQRAPAPVRDRDPIADLINGVDMRPPAEIRGVASAKPASPRRTVEN